METSNYKKHTSTNPLQKLLINNFENSLVSLVKPLGISKALDVGAGEGFVLERLRKEGVGKSLEGIEYLDDAIKTGKKIHPKVKILKGDIYDLPYKANSFDLVMCVEVLEHLQKPRKGLKELVRVSSKYILLSVPHEPFFMLSNFLRGKNITRWGNDIEHINHWSSSSFERFAKKEKVKVLYKRHPFPWTVLLLRKK